MKGIAVLGLFAAACLGFACYAPDAFAAVANPNEIPWGDAVADVGASAVEPIKLTLTAIITGVLLKYAGPLGMFIRQGYISSLVDRAVDFAYGATAGAQKGKVLDVSTVPEFMRNVLLFANGNFPWVLRFLIKHVRGLVEMALSRIVADLPAEFRYTPALAADLEHAAGGIVKRPSPVSSLLAQLKLV